MARDPRIDAYIEKSGDFARPILIRFRELVHATIPEADETVKWGMPHFTHKGKNLAGMGAFKAHCALIVHGSGRQGAVAADSGGMGSYGKIASLAEMPEDFELADKLKEARDRIDRAGSAVKRAPKRESKAGWAVPKDFATALREHPAANATFEILLPWQQREYVDWISDAKQDATRARRLATAIEWLAEGKRRNWKYERLKGLRDGG